MPDRSRRFRLRPDGDFRIQPDAGELAPPVSLIERMRELRQQVRAVVKTLEGLPPAMARLDARIEQLLMLQHDEPDIGARLDPLERVLDLPTVTRRINEAVAAAAVVAAPVSHLVVESLLPAAAYHAVLEAVPDAAFFNEAGSARRELSVPPTLAPLVTVVVWRFMAQVATEVIGPALADKFSDVVDRHVKSLKPSIDVGAGRLTASHGRLVLRMPGYQERARRPRPWHFLTGVVSLGREGEAADRGSVLRDANGAELIVPFRGNTLLAVFDPEGAHEYGGVRADASGTRCSYEFPIGPDAAMRRRLASL